jgi:hypothetical protein
MAARRWSDAQKAEQSTKIHSWKPWQHSTGARTSEGKAISAMNAHSGYFRRRERLGQWLLWAKNHTSVLTPELIAETIVRADKLNIDLPESKQHKQFFNDMAYASVNAAMAEIPCKKMIGFCLTADLVSAARKTVLGDD